MLQPMLKPLRQTATLLLQPQLGGLGPGDLLLQLQGRNETTCNKAGEHNRCSCAQNAALPLQGASTPMKTSQIPATSKTLVVSP